MNVNMTKEQAAKLWPIIKAWSEGATVQRKLSDSDVWIECERPGFYSFCQYRIKPSKSVKPSESVKHYRPWTIEDAPVGCVIRHINDISKVLCPIFWDKDHCVIAFESDDVYSLTHIGITYNDLVLWHEFSINNGKTWHLCQSLIEE